MGGDNDNGKTYHSASKSRNGVSETTILTEGEIHIVHLESGKEIKLSEVIANSVAIAKRLGLVPAVIGSLSMN